MIRLEESLTGNEKNYVAPFFWQHGEDEEILREYMQVIWDANIRAVCVESRPHPDFVGPKWWRDMDVILEEANKRNMKVWILDDSHFPTGYANGAVKTAPKELKHQYLIYQMLEMSGSATGLELPVREYMLSGLTGQKDPEAELVKVLACPVETGEKLGHPIDLTGCLQEGTDLLRFDLPDGYFRIFVIYLTLEARGRNDYINFMDSESCKLLVDTVYEPHFEHYKEYFGNTIAGFFSDEPPIGNVEGYMPAGPIGTPMQNLPWSRLAADRFTEEFGSRDWMLYLPYLWAEATDQSLQAKERNAYMQMVSKLVAECFSKQLGDWCRNHGVEYIGHMLEDCDINSDLGISMGHYFRGLSGQDMAGIDNIGGQVMINGEDVPRHPGSACKDEAGFYHYLMGKLGASHAAIDPKKKGRCMCENFGAYGWQMGTKEQKFMKDHFMVRGVNRFVPHAFSPASFPDPDCPPHFYANGEDPLYRAFGQLMAYTNRVCHMIDGGKPLPDVAILYNGESKWAGNGDSNIAAARVLTQSQIDFHVIPSDVFAENGGYPLEFDGTVLRVNGNSYQALIISGCDFLEKSAAKFVEQAVLAQYPVLFLDRLPKGISGASEEENQRFTETLRVCSPILTNQIGQYCKGYLKPQVVCNPAEKKLVSYHYLSEQEEVLILNENAERVYEGSVSLRVAAGSKPERLLRWYPWENRLETVPFTWLEEGLICVPLTILPLELCVLIPTYDNIPLDAYLTAPGKLETESYELTEFMVERVDAKEYSKISALVKKEGATVVDTVTAPFVGMQMRYPEYSGYYIYKAAVMLEPGTGYRLKIEDAYESVEVFLNGESCGMKLQKPFVFELTEAASSRENILQVEVATTLERKVKAMGADIHSMSMPRPLSPTGIVGKVMLYQINNN